LDPGQIHEAAGEVADQAEEAQPTSPVSDLAPSSGLPATARPATAGGTSIRRETGKASFGWLHLTDLHFGMSGQKWLWPNMREEFFSDLEKLHPKSGPWDLVLFTGDFVQKGGSDEFEGLNELLGRLWDHMRGLGSDPYLLGV